MMKVTVLEALKAEISYPVPMSFFKATLIKRGVDGDAEFTAELANSRAYRLCYADCVKRHLLAISVSEGSLSVSIADKELLLNVANGIYREYGEPEVILKEEATVTYMGEDFDD